MQPKSKKKNTILTLPGKSLWDYSTSSPFAYIIIFFSVFLIYGNILSFYLGKLDEPDILLVNMRFLGDFGNLKKIFTTDAFFSTHNCLFYRPLQSLTFMIDAHMSGANGWGYYLTNMLIHAITCSLLYNLLKLVGNEKKGALLLVLIYAASPLFVQVLAWAPSRGDLLIGMFGILSFIFFIRYIRSKRTLFLVINLVATMAAVFSKETAILLPVLFLIYYFLVEKEKRVTPAGLIVPLCGYVLIIAIYLFLRHGVVTGPLPAAVFGITPFVNNLRILPESLSKFFLPVNLSPMPAFGWFQTLSGLAVAGLFIFIAVKYLSGSARWVYFGFFWFLLFTIPGMFYSHPMGDAAYAYLEHRAYMPLAGILIALSFMLQRIGNQKIKQQLYFLLFLVAVAYGIYARVYSANYANPITFYNRAVESNPGSAVAYYNRGGINLFHEKNYQSAMEDCDLALKVKPDYAKALVNRGICREFLGDTLAGLKDCEAGAKLDPGMFIAHKNIAIVRNQLGFKEVALREWDLALQISPDYFEGYNERGIIKFQLKDYPAAEADFTRCLQVNNRFPEAYLNRGLLYHEMNDLNRACSDWQSAASLGNDNAFGLLREYCGK